MRQYDIEALEDQNRMLQHEHWELVQFLRERAPRTLEKFKNGERSKRKYTHEQGLILAIVGI